MRGLLVFRKRWLPLASSRDSSNGPDVRDIAVAMMEFQEASDGMVIVALSAVDLGAGPTIMARAEVWPVGHEVPAPVPLVSVSAICSVLGSQTLGTAVFRLLYALDFQLALDAEKRVNGE
jgi:hypothetical protein